MSRAGPSIRRTRHGDFEVRISAEERAILRTLPGHLRQLLDERPADDPGLSRLYPAAHPDDEARQAEFRALVEDDLTRQRREALETMEATLSANRLDEDQLSAWLSVLNDLRLLLGTRLDVTEEMYEQGFPEDDPRAPSFALYGYLGFLEEQVVAALASSLPDEGSAPQGEPS